MITHIGILEESEDLGIKNIHDKRGKQESLDSNVVFEYFDKEGFCNIIMVENFFVVKFLYERDKPYDGVLQKFIGPKSSRNCKSFSSYV
jgi:hypothetical protein